MHLTSHITHSNGYAPYIAYYRSNGLDQLFRKLKPKPKLNPPNAHRSQIKICEKRQTKNVQFRFLSQFRKVRNAFECFVTQVQTRLPKTKCVWTMKINVICTGGWHFICWSLICLIFSTWIVIYIYIILRDWGYLRETWCVIYYLRDMWLRHLFPRENYANPHYDIFNVRCITISTITMIPYMFSLGDFPKCRWRLHV